MMRRLDAKHRKQLKRESTWAAIQKMTMI